MMSAKNLVKLANKWKRIAAASRKRIPFPRTNTFTKSSTAAADKGKFVIYTTDEKRFALPLEYLESQVVRELLRTSPHHVTTLPWPHHVQKIVAREMEEALILSLLSDLCRLKLRHPCQHICAKSNCQLVAVDREWRTIISQFCL